MTINYTPLLSLAEPVTGTQSGTWGDDVNQGLTDYLDIAIAGAQVISGSQTAVTLSKTTGSAAATNIAQVGSAGTTGTAQYAVINCTGNPASMLTITAPTTSKTYVVINSTSTSQPVKLVGVGPTTGVTVAAGQAALVAWKGTDFTLVATTDASKLTGILSPANGGTGVNNGSFTATLGGNLSTGGTLSTTGAFSTAGAFTTAGANALTLTTTGATNVTFPVTGTLATRAGSETLTNKTINGPDNTLTNIANASLANSAITINGNSVSLGGSTTVTAVATNALTIGTGLSGGSYNGSTAVTIALAAGYGDTLNPYASKTANFVLAAPNGSAGAPTFRAIVAADIPTLNQNTTGTAAGLSVTLAIGSGGTGATTAQGAIDALAGAVTSGQYLRGNGTNVVMSAIQAADVPTLNQNTTGNANTATTATNLSGGIVRTGIASVASSSTITPTSDTVNQYNVTALAVPAAIAAPSGTPVDGQKLIIRLRDNNTAQGLTWNAIYRTIGTILPSTTVATKTTYVGCIYNSADAVWDVVSVTTQG